MPPAIEEFTGQFISTVPSSMELRSAIRLTFVWAKKFQEFRPDRHPDEISSFIRDVETICGQPLELNITGFDMADIRSGLNISVPAMIHGLNMRTNLSSNQKEAFHRIRDLDWRKLFRIDPF